MKCDPQKVKFIYLFVKIAMHGKTNVHTYIHYTISLLVAYHLGIAFIYTGICDYYRIPTSPAISLIILTMF